MTARRSTVAINMAKLWLSVLCLALALNPLRAATNDPLRIAKPSVFLEAHENGYISLDAGYGGNVNVTLGGSNTTGSIYLGDEDLLYLIEIIQSLPPVWEEQVPHGYLGVFQAGRTVRVQLRARDPEGLSIHYERVAGAFPPGVTIDRTSGVVKGVAPDADATYSFTIRATDAHGKHADSIFKMVVKGVNGCSSKPCKFEGVCTDVPEGFQCACVRPYGGVTCNLRCSSNALGISNSYRWVNDAQMSAYRTYSSYYAYNARYGGSSFWAGLDAKSYLQIDFGNETNIYRVDMQGYSTAYYTYRFRMEYSLDGNTFHNYTDYTGAVQTLSGPTSSSYATNTLPQVMVARFVRLFPVSWNTSYRPAMKVEMYGCHVY